MGAITSRYSSTGSVSILSLWILALMLCLALSLSYRVRIGLQLDRYVWDKIRLLQVAKMAVCDGVSYWTQTSPNYTALNQPWSQSLRFKDHALPDGSYSALRDPSYGLEDEYSRINLNKASPEILNRLFEAHPEVVPEILNWRSTSGGGPDYTALGYKSRHGPFKSVNELLLVQGITPEIFLDVKDFLTVDTSGQINVNTATQRVLEALGFSPSLVGKILEFRQGDGVFTDVGSISSRLKAAVVLSGDEPESLAKILQTKRLCVQSDAVRLRILARLNDSRAICRVTVVASGHTHEARILQWQENR